MCLKFNLYINYSGCDACEDWYHGDCIGITRKQSKLIKQYFCDVCLYVILWGKKHVSNFYIVTTFCLLFLEM